MDKVIKKVQIITQIIAFVMVFITWGGCVIVGIAVSANYDFADFPYFTWNSYEHYISILAAVIVLFVMMKLGAFVKWHPYIAYGIFAVLSFAMIFMIPLEPFSDMKEIYEIATSDMQDIHGYLRIYPNQIPVTLYLFVLVSCFGKHIIVLKMANIIWNFLILYFLSNIYKEIEMRKNKSTEEAKMLQHRMLWFSVLFFPVFLYTNHIYSDIPATGLSVILLYLVIRKRYRAVDIVCIIVISVLQYLIRASGILFIIAIAMYMILVQKKLRIAVFCTTLSLVGIFTVSSLNTKIFSVDKSQIYSVWSYLQMGVNEKEFGFQDGTHSTEWTMQDCIDKYKKLGVKRVLNIYIKKELWMWSEGTYQAQRYGFGDDEAQYQYDTAATKDLRNFEHSRLRYGTEALMKGQYALYMLLAVLGVWYTKHDKRYALFLYLICGFICFYLLWEIKSRYIYGLYPIFLLYAMQGSAWMKNINKLL